MNNDIYSKYIQANQYLNQGLIRTSVLSQPNGQTHREWMLNFLGDLGHPEQAYPAIHVAGTSGKGSTCIMIAEILRAAGYKVGLHTSPYLQVATEKLWINGRYASTEEFIDLVEWIRPVCEKWRRPHVPLHGMASLGICLEYFRRNQIDVAVIETGVGGRDDITNVLNTLLAVITPLGIDHTKTLGNSIASIAKHKAGIIKPNVPVVAFKGDGEKVISRTADIRHAPLRWVENQPITENFKTAMCGRYQDINTMMAKTAIEAISNIGYSVNNEDIITGLKKARLPGRMETLQKSPEVIIDGAHNHQKLTSLLAEFTNRDITIVFGLLQSKLSRDILDTLTKHDRRTIITKPNVYAKDGLPTEQLLKVLAPKNVRAIENPAEALKEALGSVSEGATILVTGSLYLTGEIRELYYHSKLILESRTSWPQL